MDRAKLNYYDRNTAEVVAKNRPWMLVRGGSNFGSPPPGRAWWMWVAALAGISAGIYLPLEFHHFAHHLIFLNAAVICLNVLVVLYLAKLLTSSEPDGAEPPAIVQPWPTILRTTS